MQTDVLVVGAGPSGLVMAIELARYGVRCRIIDKVPPRPYSESRAEGIHAKTLDIFERQGILPSIMDAGKILHGFSFFADGEPLGRIAFDSLDTAHPYAILLPQSEVERVLLERLETLGIVVERPVELLSFEQGDTTVFAHIKTASGDEQEIQARFLIGADGGHSTVRHLLHLDFPGHRMQGAYVMDADMTIAVPLPPNDGTFILGPHGFLVLGLRPDGLWRIALSLPQDDRRMGKEAPTKEQLQHILDTDFPSMGIRLNTTSWSSAFFLSSRIVPEVRRDHVFLIGDAAHIHSPVGGQGMNTGIQDAVNLAWKVAMSLRYRVAPTLLESYHDERYPVMKRLIASTNASTMPLLISQPLMISIRNFLLHQLTQFEALQTYLISSFTGFDVKYLHSPVTTNLDGSRHPGAGEYSPDVTGLYAGTVANGRLATIIGESTKHQLIAFMPEDVAPEDLPELYQQYQQHIQRFEEFVHLWLITPHQIAHPGVISDPAGHARQRFHASSGDWFLLRPDGFIGLTGHKSSFVQGISYPGVLL